MLAFEFRVRMTFGRGVWEGPFWGGVALRGCLSVRSRMTTSVYINIYSRVTLGLCRRSSCWAGGTWPAKTLRDFPG